MRERERERRRGGDGFAVESLVRRAVNPSRAPGPRASSRDGYQPGTGIGIGTRRITKWGNGNAMKMRRVRYRGYGE